MDNIRSLVRERYKSFDDCDIWLDREDHAVLENGHAYVSISEYCGLVAVCLVVKENDQFYYTGHTNVHGAWCAQVGGNFREHIEKCYKGCVLSRRGAFSNGEAVFQRKTS